MTDIRVLAVPDAAEGMRDEAYAASPSVSPA